MQPTFLIYGATGFVGDLVAHEAVKSGLRPILAGRNASGVAAVAGALGLDYRVFDLADASAIDEALGSAAVVLNCAGPYVHTAQLVADACLRTGRHYLDFTGEISVLEGLATHDAAAKERGTMLMPAVGFDVVPTDCLALYLKQRLPSATRLTLAFVNDGPAQLPRGTSLTMVEQAPNGGRFRQAGRLVAVPLGSRTRFVDFGRGPVWATLTPWGDLVTAFHSTGIPNIEVYVVPPRQIGIFTHVARYAGPLLGLPAVQSFLKSQARRQGPGPTPEQRAQTHCTVWGEVEDEQGRKATARLRGPEAGATWTVSAALAVVQKVLAGDAPPGFQTPACAYGADFVLTCDSVTREDVV
jgi:short subunit dehydrogenase-like uncharacterized protein